MKKFLIIIFSIFLLTGCSNKTTNKEITFSIKEWENLNRKELTLTGSWMSYSAPFPGEEWSLVAHYFKSGQLKFDNSLIFKNRKQLFKYYDENGIAYDK